MKANKVGQEETIEVLLTRSTFPIAFQNKLNELMEQGAFDNEEDAIKWIESTPFTLEIMYQKDNGLFAVESEALVCSTLVSPYNGEEIDCDLEND
jgi:hypothetical protein